MRPVFVLFFLSACLAACSDNEEPVAINARPAKTVYSDYQVWAEEGREEVTVRLQYRLGDEEGPAVVIKEPGKVLLDGEELTADSTKLTGVYYEISRPIQEFKGKHAIVLIDQNKKEHREEFTFEPFTLAKELPENIKKKPFVIQLKDFPPASTLIRLVMIDTAHRSADVNEELMIENGKLTITEEFLANLVKGPVTLEIYKEEERPVIGSRNTFGKFTLTYGLRRHLNLVD